MRLWSIAPNALDRAGLLAAWREGMQAQSVLLKLERGESPGYSNHPQLERFKAQPDPVAALGLYLQSLKDEAIARGYSFKAKIERAEGEPLPVQAGQLRYEWLHLRRKLEERDYSRFAAMADAPMGGPAFFEVQGGIEDWERNVSELDRLVIGVCSPGEEDDLLDYLEEAEILMEASP